MRGVFVVSHSHGGSSHRRTVGLNPRPSMLEMQYIFSMKGTNYFHRGCWWTTEVVEVGSRFNQWLNICYRVTASINFCSWFYGMIRYKLIVLETAIVAVFQSSLGKRDVFGLTIHHALLQAIWHAAIIAFDLRWSKLWLSLIRDWSMTPLSFRQVSETAGDVTQLS